MKASANSEPYHRCGRTAQKARTREALLVATRAFLDEGIPPTVEQVADRASISRTTAYRYFANQRALLAAIEPELEESSLLGADAPDDVVARLDVVLERFLGQLVRREAAQRTQLRLSLEHGSGTDPPVLPLRQGRAIAWIEDALAPLRRSHPDIDLHRLALAIRATSGIESLVWLTDVAGLTLTDAVKLMRESARTLLRAALAEADAATSARPS